MNVWEIVLYLMGAFGSASTFSYLDGRAKLAFERREVQYRPPYFFGVLTSVVWPLQLLGALFFVALVVPHRKGQQRGIAVNEELSTLREQARHRSMEDAAIIKLLNEGVDPETMLRAIHGDAVKQLEASKPNELDDIVESVRLDKKEIK